MSEPRCARRRRTLRREIWRRAWPGLAVVAAISAAAVFWFGMGIPFASSTELHGHRPMDTSLHHWLAVIALGLALALDRGKMRLRPLLRRLPVSPAEELRCRLALGLICGAVVFAAFLLVELLARPVMRNPSFGDRINPAEASTLESLGGVLLLRFIVDGEVSRIPVTAETLAKVRTHGIWGYGDSETVERSSRLAESEAEIARLLAGGEPAPPIRVEKLPPSGQVLAQVKTEDWARLHAYHWDHLRDLGLAREAEVEIVYEGLVSPAEYLQGEWRRDGLYRDRAWPWVDRAMGFLALLVLGICILVPVQRFSFAVLTVVLLAVVLKLASYELGRWISLISFSELGPRFTLGIPRYQAKLEWSHLWAWPACMAVLILIACGAGARDLTRLYAGWPSNGRLLLHTSPFIAILAISDAEGWPIVFLGVLVGHILIELLRDPFSNAAGAVVHGLWLAGAVAGALVGTRLELWSLPSAAPGLSTRAGEGSSFFALVGDVSGLLDFSKVMLSLSWLAAFAGVAFLIASRAETWARRDLLLARLPVSPRVIARRRFRRSLVDLSLLSLAPLALEKTVLLVWQGTASIHGRELAASDFSPDLGWWASTIILGCGMAILHLTQFAGQRGVPAAVAAVVALGTASVWLFGHGAAAGWILALAAVSLPQLYRAMERRVVTAVERGGV